MSDRTWDQEPDPYVEACFVEMEDHGHFTQEGRRLHHCKTKCRKNTSAPAWNRPFHLRFANHAH